MKFEPHDYQAHCIEQIVDQDHVGLFLAMGLGKTVITLTAVEQLIYDRFEISRCLVIAPKRVAETTWDDEAQKWDHLRHLRISKILGTAQERRDGAAAEADIYLINRENVVWLVREYEKKWKWDMIVIDELSSFKSNQAKRFRALRRVRPLADRIVGLTGTPSPNGLMDLWADIYLLDGGKRLGPTITGYRDKYFNPGRRNGYTVFSWEPKKGAAQKIEHLLSDLCISMKAEDYLDMPDVIVNDIPVRLSEKEEEQYQQFERDQIMELDGQELTAFDAAAVWGKLLQLANGAAYDADHMVVDFHDRKLEALEEIVDTATSPVLVFYNFRHDLERIQGRIGGRVLQDPEDIRSWNRGEIPVLLAQPASMGHGLNLQAGGHIIVWYGLNPSLELYQQANARLNRQGQEETVIIHRLVTRGTVDEDVIKKLETKERGQDSLIEALKARIRSCREKQNGRYH